MPDVLNMLQIKTQHFIPALDNKFDCLQGNKF